jgi:hypothetical protein
MTACFLFLPSSFFYCVPLFSFLGWFRVGCGIRVGPEYGCLVPQAPKHWAVPAVDESGFAACIAQRMHTVMQGAVVVPVILSPVDQDVADSLHRRGMVEARRRDSSSRLGRIWRGRDTAIVRVVFSSSITSSSRGFVYDGILCSTDEHLLAHQPTYTQESNSPLTPDITPFTLNSNDGSLSLYRWCQHQLWPGAGSGGAREGRPGHCGCSVAVQRPGQPEGRWY